MISVVRWHGSLSVYDGKRDAGPSTEELWELYQKSGSYEDMTRWLKHAAYERIEEEIWRGVVRSVFDDAIIPIPSSACNL